MQFHTGKHVLKNRTVLALLLTGFGKSLINQYGIFGFVLSGFDSQVPRQDSTVLVVSLLSAVISEQIYMLEAFFTSAFCKVINNDLDMHIQAKTNDRKVRRFGDILAPLSRETKLKMRLRE